MNLGIFAKTFTRPTLAGVLDAVQAHGLSVIQFNMVCAGLPALPDEIDPALAAQIKAEITARQLTMAAVSGTYNMIHPDPAERQAGLRRLSVLAAACRPMGATVITLCTGTRDPHNQWRGHPDNQTLAAWRDLTLAMDAALDLAEAYDLTLAIEPELANVVDSAAKAARLMAELRSSRLKAIIDPANILPAGTLPRQREIIDEALDLLGPHLIMAHAKDLSADGQAGNVAAGSGRLDYAYYLAGLRRIGFNGPLIMHGLTEAQVPQTVEFLRGLL